MNMPDDKRFNGGEFPLVSVIVPAYGQAKYLSDVLESLLSQTYKNWEAIIVDDGSPDDVLVIAEKYVSNDSRIRFYHTDNNGLCRARNFAIGKSSGEYILPLDADDKIASTYIEKCVERFMEYPETTLVYSQWQYFGTDRRTPALSYEGYKILLHRNSIFCSAMFRKNEFLLAGGYDENMIGGYEDWELWIRMLSPQSIVYQIPEPLFFYRQKEISRNKSAMNNQRLNSYIFTKHRDKYEKYIYDPLWAYDQADVWKRKYLNIWYKKLWFKLWKPYREKHRI